MGWIIGRGNSFVFRTGGGQSLSWYWSQQPEVLFFGLYSEISGGQMPNKVKGATDFLTVAGVAGSETYQAPNTAAYIAADTDYIWFKTDASQRTTTTAELIGYDLQRTPVKYNDTTPNAIVAIMILKATVTGTKRDRMFRDFWLPIMWDNAWNDYGHEKENRPDTGQILWTPELTTFVYDTFTATDGTHLADHTMDIGDGWTASDNWTISGNKLVSSDTTNFVAICESSQSDCIITLDIAQQSSSYLYEGVLFRYVDPTHFWTVVINRWGVSVAAITLFETNGGAATQRATASIVVETATRTMKVVLNGNNMNIFWDDMDTPKITYINALFNTATKHGIVQYINAQHTATTFDNFKIDPI